MIIKLYIYICIVHCARIAWIFNLAWPKTEPFSSGSLWGFDCWVSVPFALGLKVFHYRFITRMQGHFIGFVRAWYCLIIPQRSIRCQTKQIPFKTWILFQDDSLIIDKHVLNLIKECFERMTYNFKIQIEPYLYMFFIKLSGLLQK